MVSPHRLADISRAVLDRRLKRHPQTSIGGGGFVRGATLQIRRMREHTQLSLVKSDADPSARTTRADICAIFEQVLGRPVEITDNTDIVEDLGMDSLGVMDFVMAVEDFYDISIPLDRIAQVQTVGDLVAAVDQLRKGA